MEYLGSRFALLGEKAAVFLGKGISKAVLFNEKARLDALVNIDLELTGEAVSKKGYLFVASSSSLIVSYPVSGLKSCEFLARLVTEAIPNENLDAYNSFGIDY